VRGSATSAARSVPLAPPHSFGHRSRVSSVVRFDFVHHPLRRLLYTERYIREVMDASSTAHRQEHTCSAPFTPVQQPVMNPPRFVFCVCGKFNTHTTTSSVVPQRVLYERPFPYQRLTTPEDSHCPYLVHNCADDSGSSCIHDSSQAMPDEMYIQNTNKTLHPSGVSLLAVRGHTVMSVNRSSVREQAQIKSRSRTMQTLLKVREDQTLLANSEPRPHTTQAATTRTAFSTRATAERFAIPTHMSHRSCGTGISTA